MHSEYPESRPFFWNFVDDEPIPKVTQPKAKIKLKSKEQPSNVKAKTQPMSTIIEDDDDLTLPSYGRNISVSKQPPIVTPPVIVAKSSAPEKPNRPEKQPKTEKLNKPELPEKQPKPKTPKPVSDAPIIVEKPTTKNEPRNEPRKMQPKKTPVLTVSPSESLPKPIPAITSGGPPRTRRVWDPDIREYVPIEKARIELVPAELRGLLPAAPQPTAPPPAAVVDVAAEKPAPQKETEKTEKTEKPEKKRQKQKRSPKSVADSLEMSDAESGEEDSLSSGFGSISLSETMLTALKAARYHSPTPIQAGVIPQVLDGIDLMGQARTGTGKTAAFLIPLIEKLEDCEPGEEPVALILVPTRELAVQIKDEAHKLSFGRDVRIAACYGGKPIASQLTRLQEGVDIVIGTPGRILDLLGRHALSCKNLRWVVLDEADRMLDIGFRPDIEKILKQTPASRQTLLFSATLPQPVVRLAERYMKEPEILDFSAKNIDVETIEQFYITVDHERKFDALLFLLERENPKQAIIFCRTKRRADRTARLLKDKIESIAAIHGDLQQSVRDKVMTQFRNGSLRFLVATDVVGRGIDVSGISHIINFDIPNFCDDYVHRVGRTGRMGREGVAYTFVTAQEGPELTRIEIRIDRLLQRATLVGFEAFSKPTADIEEPADSDAKPVYGKSVRKVRKAL